jgi:AcrR family transcriptional regulator
VGIGTFYDYVSDKQALAALTIHRRVRGLASLLVDAAQAHAGWPLAQLVPLRVEQQIETMRRDARAWAALYQLEREISPPEAYRKNYRRYVEAWATALAVAGDAPPADELARLARAVHVLTYGAVFQSLLTQGVRTDWAQLKADLGRSLQGHLGLA